MIKIKKLHLPHLRNEEWFEFMREIKQLITMDTVVCESMSDEMETLTELLHKAELALRQMRKSEISQEIVALDRKRENIYTGLKYHLLSAKYHFQTQKQNAGQVLLTVLKSYGNIFKQTYYEESGTIQHLTEILQNKYGNEVSILGIEEWISQLQSVNEEFFTALQNRNKEQGQKIKFTMADVRLQTDICYRSITEKLEALALLNSQNDSFHDVINNINAAVKKNKNLLTHRNTKNE
ncbi:MAG: DUF6261 family protein [Bacteroidales bacterium]|jgi:hypothetical protein|nr:DUF6261 family protein [Bacteroidales bacterium]